MRKSFFVVFVFELSTSFHAQRGKDIEGVLGARYLGLGTWRPAILESRLLAAELMHLGLGTEADHEQSWNPDYWQLDLGT